MTDPHALVGAAHQLVDLLVPTVGHPDIEVTGEEDRVDRRLPDKKEVIGAPMPPHVHRHLGVGVPLHLPVLGNHELFQKI